MQASRYNFGIENDRDKSTCQQTKDSNVHAKILKVVYVISWQLK